MLFAKSTFGSCAFVFSVDVGGHHEEKKQDKTISGREVVERVGMALLRLRILIISIFLGSIEGRFSFKQMDLHKS